MCLGSIILAAAGNIFILGSNLDALLRSRAWRFSFFAPTYQKSRDKTLLAPEVLLTFEKQTNRPHLLFRPLGEMVRQARVLAQATSDLVNAMRSDAEAEIDMENSKKLLAAAKLLADSTARMVEAAKVFYWICLYEK